MVSLIFDTDIWISFIAKDKPSGILDEIQQKVNNSEIVLLTNDVIIDEWKRNKEQTLKAAENIIQGTFKSAKKSFEYYSEEKQEKFDELISDFFESKEELIENAKLQVERTDELLLSCEKTPISDEMKLQIIDWALEKRAPFHSKNNSVGDALILLSSVNYLKEQTIGITDSIFVSFNHTDFSKKENKDEIHEDLAALLDEANVKFTRHIGEALELAPEMNKEIAEYLDYMIDDWIQTQIDIQRGK
jgi:hypothetical protein